MKNEPVISAWVQLLRAHSHVLGQIERTLKSGGFPPLGWYDVLLELERNGEPMRSLELQSQLLLEQYNLSRVLDRMEAKHLITRKPNPKDRRGRLISASKTGLALRQRMWPAYAAAVQQAVGDRLSDGEIQMLQDLLRKLGPGNAL